MQKPIIALMEPEVSRGGLSKEEVQAQLLEGEASYPKWNFDAEKTPSGQTLHDHLFDNETIDWNREHKGS